ncbi:LysM peptidoglycan-binding domain-containing protein [Microbacterium sp.]|uniref:LysM peptidoglycan-binding domain-containing protein n=1 Tax=Microbacterium sp. TaxID=51671 RepID=UPI003C7894A3
MARRGVLAARLTAVLMTATVLTGCAGMGAGVGATTESVAEGTATASAAPTPVAIPDGIVATGTMVAADGTTLGPVTVTRSGTAYRFDYPTDWLPDDPGNSLIEALSDSPFTMDECGADNIWQLGATIGQIGSFLGEAYPDPTFFTSLLVVRPTGSAGDGSCWQPILAKADLAWTTPVTRPWVDPEDAGARDGARGAVEVVDGRMLYTTASGDVWSEIARRFAITQDDLEWLNPIRIPGELHSAYAAQVLNLDPLDRGDSESRRPH